MKRQRADYLTFALILMVLTELWVAMLFNCFWELVKSYKFLHYQNTASAYVTYISLGHNVAVFVYEFINRTRSSEDYLLHPNLHIISFSNISKISIDFCIFIAVSHELTSALSIRWQAQSRRSAPGEIAGY